MTPIQQAIEQVKAEIASNEESQQAAISKRNWVLEESCGHAVGLLQGVLRYLQSLLPVEKEWGQDVFEAGYHSGRTDYSTHKAGQTFEQYYSQFNEVK